MAVITLRPSGDGTTTGWTRFPASGTFASQIDEAVASNDGDSTYVQSPNVTTGTLFFDLDNVPADFDPAAINSITINVAHRRLNTPQMTADAGTVTAFLVRADETTAISTTPTAVASPIQAGYQQDGFTPSPTGTHTLTDWNAARLALTFTHTTAQTLDTVNQVRISAAEVVIDYTPASSDVTVGLSGVQSSGMITTFGVALSIAAAGLFASGSVGTMSGDVSGELIGGYRSASAFWVGGASAPSSGVTVGLTGVSTTGAVGTLAPSITILPGQPVLTVDANSAVGTVTPSTATALTGESSTGAVGTTTPSTTTALTGVSTTGQVGSVSAGADVQQALTGVESTTAVGSVTASGENSASLTGVQATGAVGTLAPSTSMALTGTSATGAVGSVTASSAAGATLTGVQATGQVGSVQASGSGTASLSGVQSTTALGTLSPDTSTALTGPSSTGSVGSLAPAQSVELSGSATTGQVGSVSAGADSSQALTGVQATGSVGSVTFELGAPPEATADVEVIVRASVREVLVRPSVREVLVRGSVTEVVA